MHIVQYAVGDRYADQKETVKSGKYGCPAPERNCLIAAKADGGALVPAATSPRRKGVELPARLILFA